MGAPRRHPFANAWFFPAAALYGAVSVPLWALGAAGHLALLPGLGTPAGHAHEMLTGYGLAVVAGFLLGPQPPAFTLTLLVLWLAGRIAFLFWPGTWPAVALTAVFAISVAARVIPRFAPAAKKWRNQSVVWIVAGLAAATVAMTLAYGRWNAEAIRAALIILFAALLFFMGGRIIAPAVAGHLIRRGHELDARVQPALEGAVLLLLLAAIVGTVSPGIPGTIRDALAAAPLVLAGLLVAVRLARWRLWLCADRPDLLMLAVGYAWLAVGIGLGGASRLGLVADGVAVHALTLGALGTLTVTVMARTRLLYHFRDANIAPEAHPAALLMSGAALARIAWTYAPAPLGIDLLVVSAGLWSTSCLLLLRTLFRTLNGGPRRLRAGGARTADNPPGPD